MTRELNTNYDSRQSFYGKAFEDYTDDKIILYSYNTRVAEIDRNTHTATVIGTYSATTLRHIKEFLKQHGFEAESKAQIEKDYM
jgi:hypothetical protein